MTTSKKQYSNEFKEQALAKVYSRGQRTIQSIADELNLNIYTLKNWMKNAATTSNPAKRPQDWRPEERLLALQESHSLSGEALNAWCRERGVFTHQLAQWRTEFCTAVGTGSSREETQSLRHLKAENQRLERELKRKEKALAEAAALLVLQKKFQALLGGEAE